MVDMVDEAQQLAEDQREDALAAHRRRRPPAIPRGGMCADCGAPIDAARLAVCPTARRCAFCQNQHERTPRE